MLAGILSDHAKELGLLHGSIDVQEDVLIVLGAMGFPLRGEQADKLLINF